MVTLLGRDDQQAMQDGHSRVVKRYLKNSELVETILRDLQLILGIAFAPWIRGLVTSKRLPSRTQFEVLSGLGERGDFHLGVDFFHVQLLTVRQQAVLSLA